MILGRRPRGARSDRAAPRGWSRERRAAAGRAVLHAVGGVRRRPRGVPRGRPRGRRLLPGPVEPRQGRPLDPRRELHGLVLVEGLRQGRDHHLGEPADRLPLGRPRPPGVRAPRMPARRCVLLVHLLADPGPLPVRPRRAGRDVPRGARSARRPGARVGRDRRRPGQAPPLPAGPRQGRPGAGQLARGGRHGRRRARAHDQDPRPGPVHRLLADPGHVDGVALRRHPVHPAHRRRDDVVLRLVRRPAGRQPAGLRRPDRRPGVRRLVGRDLPDDVGLQRPRHPHARRALDGRGPLPRHQGRHRQPRLRRQHQVRRRVDARPGRHRRRARDGHGSRAAQGVLRRPAHAVLRRLRPAVHRPALPDPARGARGEPGGLVPGKFLTAADLGRTADARTRWKTVLLDGATGRAGGAQRLDGLPLRRVRRREVEPRPRGRLPGAHAGRRGQRAGRGAAAGVRRRRRLRLGAAPRRPGSPASATTWSPRSST